LLRGLSSLAILVNSDIKVLVQGITGTQGSFHTALMREYGTKVISGTSPGKGGTFVHDVPVYETVKQAQSENFADASVIFVPAPSAADAAIEAIVAGIKLVVVITEHVPIKDVISLFSYAVTSGSVVVGPNTPGVITPGECKIGILPSQVFAKGNIGVASRSGTLTYEVSSILSKTGLGQSTCVGIGGDPVTGLSFVDLLKMFAADPETNAVVLIGEIGGVAEEIAADYIARERYRKPVVAYVAGRTAPEGKRMGHAGAIVTGKSGTAQSKIQAFEDAGVKVAEKPSDVAKLLSEVLN
jgi:succinyl-CoA synthetase alpha subunit